MIYAETSPHVTHLIELPKSYRFIGDEEDILREQQQLRNAARALIHIGEAGGLAFSLESALDKGPGVVVRPDDLAFRALQRTCERFDQAIMHHCLENNMQLQAMGLDAPKVIGADGLLRQLSDRGAELIYDDIETVLGVSGEEEKVPGFAEYPDTAAFYFDIRKGAHGEVELVAPVEYTSIGRLAGDLYLPMDRIGPS